MSFSIESSDSSISVTRSEAVTIAQGLKGNHKGWDSMSIRTKYGNAHTYQFHPDGWDNSDGMGGFHIIDGLLWVSFPLDRCNESSIAYSQDPRWAVKGIIVEDGSLVMDCRSRDANGPSVMIRISVRED